MVPVKRFLAAAAVCVILGGCALAGPENRETPSSPASEPVSAPEPVSRQVTLVAAGDNLIHDVIWMQASRRAGGNGYDFAPAYEAIAPIVAEADFAFVNQETVLAGAELPLSNYPRFCSPPEVGETMLDLGFNLIATANNHCFDQGEAGVRLSQEFWDSHPEAAVAGSYADAAHRDRIAVTENEDGVRVALIAATELTNGLSLPADSEGGVLRLGDKEAILEKLTAAREQADIVVLSLHWGAEGAGVPTEAQKQLAADFAEGGADVILGHHSHVLQGGEWIKTSRGQSYVAYSLGNFISAQVGAENMLAGLLQLGITVPAEGAPVLESVEFIPTVTHYGSGFSGLCILPLEGYTEAQALSHGVRQHDSRFSLSYLQAQLAALDFGETSSADSAPSAPEEILKSGKD